MNHIRKLLPAACGQNYKKPKAAVSGFGFLDILTTDASKAVLSSSFLDTVFVTARAGIEFAAGVATVKGVIN